MAVKYLAPFWGSEHLTPKAFIDFALSNDFDGIEINISENQSFTSEFVTVLEEAKSKTSFLFVAQQVLSNQKETAENYTNRVLKKLEQLLPFQPDFINSHTGKDYYSFDENCKIIDAVETFAQKHNVPIYHEIHRGRFTFHSATTLQYLETFPNLKFVGDFSHWCLVSESMLQDQEEIINHILPKIQHIHARVGYEQASQVNHAFAPEWAQHLETFINWWQKIVTYHQDKITITPEFGPFPYMPQVPFSQVPLANQTELIIQMKTHLKTCLN